MNFDKSRAYSAINAEEVKIGSKGYFADTVGTLKEAVRGEDNVMFGEIKEILSNFTPYRFGIKNEDEYAFFYLVEEPQERR